MFWLIEAVILVSIKKISNFLWKYKTMQWLRIKMNPNFWTDLMQIIMQILFPKICKDQPRWPLNINDMKNTNSQKQEQH